MHSPSLQTDGVQRPSHSPGWPSRVAEPRARRKTHRRGSRLVATLPQDLSRRGSCRQKLLSDGSRGWPLASLQSAQTVHCRGVCLVPQRNPSSACCCRLYSPAFVWVRAPTTGSGGVQGSLRCRAPAPWRRQPMPLGFASAAGGLSDPPRGAPALKPAARRRRGRRPQRAADGTAGLPKPRRGLAASSDPAVNPRFCKGPRHGPPARPLPLFPRFPPLSPLHSSPRPPSLGQVTSLLDIRGHPPGPLRRELPNLGSGTVPSLSLHSPLWHQSPEPGQLPGPGFLQLCAHDLYLVHRP